jgi:hypothetical protein
MLISILAQQGLGAGGKVDPALVPIVIVPESAPAHSISLLAVFVLVMLVCVVVAARE